MIWKGIDVSYWNGRLTAGQYKQIKGRGYRFVIARAGGYRGTMADSTFLHNYRMAEATGLDFGAYYYSTAMTPSQARAEARHAAALCRNLQFAYPVWMDVEDAATLGRLSKPALTRVIRAFVDEMRRQGRKAGVYASYYWLEEKIGDLKGIDVWTAQYHETNDYSGKTAMWQYSASGRFPGVPGSFDLDRCYKNYSGKQEEREHYKGPLSLPERGYFRRGDRGRKVRDLQHFFRWYGENLEADGIYGPRTETAVRRFQRRYGLIADGLFGRKSLAQARRVTRIRKVKEFYYEEERGQ